MFAPNGKVVGILWGGNMVNSVCFKKPGAPEKVPFRCRTPSAAMINFAERADLLYADKWKWKTIQVD